MSEGTYALSKADENRENERLKNLEAASDAFTIRHLEAVGVTTGWRCLEVGAGGGSIASWLAHCVGPSGSVIATDVDPSRLTGLPAHVEVRRHDITTDHLEPAACDVAHCRFLLQHLPDPDAALERMVNALAPGGWLVVEEADFGLFELSGAAESADATRILHDLMTRWRSAEMLDSYFGRRLPAVIGALELSDVGFDAQTTVVPRGAPDYEITRLAWPTMREAAAATGTSEDDLKKVDVAFEYSTFCVGTSIFGAWGRKPG